MVFEESFISLVNNVGFPIAVCGILLWDKLKSNGKMIEVVKNNNNLLREIKEYCVTVKKL